MRGSLGAHLTTVLDGNSFSSSQWWICLSDVTNSSLVPYLPFQGVIKNPKSLGCSALLGRQRETHLTWIRWQKNPLSCGSNLSQPGFLRPDDQSCLVVMPLQHSHSDPRAQSLFGERVQSHQTPTAIIRKGKNTHLPELTSLGWNIYSTFFF